MQKRFEISILLISLLVPQTAQAQMFEGVGTQGLSVGLGAGLAASLNHGEVAAKSFQRLLQAQKYAAEQTQAIQQYMKSGMTFAAKKQWADAETCFKYVLKVTAMRDGPGSPSSVPVLKRLVAVTAAQNHVSDAISFQKTVVAFAQNAKIPNPASVVSAQVDLTKLYFKNDDFAQAAPVMQQSLQLVNAHPTLPLTQRREVKECYAKILRKLHRDSEAGAIEAELAALEPKIDPSKARTKSSPMVEINSTDDPMSIMPPGLPPEPSPASTPTVSAQPAANEAVGSVAPQPAANGAAADTVAPQPATNAAAYTVAPQPVANRAAADTVAPQPVTNAAADTVAPQPATNAAADTVAPQPATNAAAYTVAPQPVTNAAADTVAPQPVTNAAADTVAPQPVTNAAVDATAPQQATNGATDTAAPRPATNKPEDTVVPMSAADKAPYKAPDREPESPMPGDAEKNGDAGQR